MASEGCVFLTWLASKWGALWPLAQLAGVKSQIINLTSAFLLIAEGQDVNCQGRVATWRHRFVEEKPGNWFQTKVCWGVPWKLVLDTGLLASNLETGG